MINIIILILDISLCGFISLILLRKNKLSDIIIFSYPLGLLFYIVLFFIMDKTGYKYNSILNIIIFVFCFVLLIFLLIKNRKQYKIMFDLNKVPLYFYLILIYFFVKLFLYSKYSLYTWYNWDEFSAYITGSKFLSIKGFIDFRMDAPLNIIQGSYFYIFNDSVYFMRLFSPFFLVNTIYFINMKMIDMNINKHISSIVSLLFLVSSPELISKGSTYYSTVYSLFYFTTSFVLVMDYLKDKNNKNFFFPFLITVCSLLTRSEIIYLMGVFLFIVSIYYFFNDKVAFKKSIIFLISMIVFYFLWKLLYNSYPSHVDYSKSSDYIEMLTTRLQSDNLKSFLKSMISSFFDLSGFYMFSTFLIFIISTLLLFVKFIIKKGKDYLLFLSYLLVQLLYFILILLTQFFIFKLNEYLVAASFSRYFIMVLPLSYILLAYILNDFIFKKENFS